MTWAVLRAFASLFFFFWGRWKSEATVVFSIIICCWMRGSMPGVVAVRCVVLYALAVARTVVWSR